MAFFKLLKKKKDSGWKTSSTI